MPSKVKLTDKGGNALALVLYSGISYGQLEDSIGSTLSNRVRNCISRALCLAATNDVEHGTKRFELAIREVVDTQMQKEDRRHLLPLLNVVFKGFLIIQDGKVVPETERKLMTRPLFLKV
jgi:hypothetical protein